MFTGIDIVVILLVLMAFLYVNTPSKESDMKIEPLTLLVVLIVLGMMIVSFT